MVRAKGMTLEQFDGMRARLLERLAYMSEANLMTLAEVVIEAAVGPRKDQWPAEVSVINWANDLQRCPPAEHRIVASWLASVEGPRAVAAGIEVELYRFLARFRRPPVSGMDNRSIREAARDNAHQVQLIRERMARGAAAEADQDWLADYIAQRDHVRAIIERGQKKRDAA